MINQTSREEEPCGQCTEYFNRMSNIPPETRVFQMVLLHLNDVAWDKLVPPKAARRKNGFLTLFRTWILPNSAEIPQLLFQKTSRFLSPNPTIPEKSTNFFLIPDISGNTPPPPHPTPTRTTLEHDIFAAKPHCVQWDSHSTPQNCMSNRISNYFF